MPRLLARTFRALVWTVAVALLLEAALIKGPMALTRWRMQHLLADFHCIYPSQSTWSDAQRIMANWHHWGYTKGPCTSVDCEYAIEISDPIGRRIQKWWPENLRGRTWSFVLKSLYALGWRNTDFQLRVVVQDGKIVRTHSAINMDVVDAWVQPDNWDYGLILVSQVRSRLRRSDAQARNDHSHEPWILGTDEQLDDHPDYKLGRPGGCESCERIDVTYTTTLQHFELLRLTAYNLSCLTRFRPCTQIYDLLPAARNWHFYDGDYMRPKVSGGPGPVPCRTEPRALGRDAELILEVEPLRTEQKVDKSWADHPLKYEVTQAKLIRILKGEIHSAAQNPLLIETYSGSEQETPPELPEYLVQGQRAFVLLGVSSGYEPDGRFVAERCGVIDDTPANLSAIETGIAQDVPVRHPITHW